MKPTQPGGNCPVVAARIRYNSPNARAVVAAAAREKSKWDHSVCWRHQTSKCINASVRHAEAVMDQMTVTQLIQCKPQHRKACGWFPASMFPEPPKRILNRSEQGQRSEGSAWKGSGTADMRALLGRAGSPSAFAARQSAATARRRLPAACPDLLRRARSDAPTNCKRIGAVVHNQNWNAISRP